MSGQWRVEKPEWQGERCFIIAGGPSVLQQDLTLLQGQKVIAINSSWEVVPADFLVFADSRWWLDNQKAVLDRFKGRIVSLSSSIRHARILRMQRKAQPGLAKDPGFLQVQHTTLTAAINLAFHLGVKSIVLLGADGRKSDDGRDHHHAPHRWKVVPGCWDKQKPQLQAIANDIKEAGVECVNASPGSAWADIWPVVELKDYVAAERITQAA